MSDDMDRVEERVALEIDPQAAEEAFERVRPKLLGLAISDGTSFRMDAVAAASNAFQVMRALAEDRDRFRRLLTPDAFDPDGFDVEDRALALIHADALVTGGKPETAVPEAMMAEVVALRAKLLKDAEYLWGDDPALGPAVKRLRGMRERRRAARVVLKLVALFKRKWDSIAGRSRLTADDLIHAQRVALVVVKQQKLRPGRNPGEAMRTRAGLHLREAVEAIRDAARYVFREDRKALARYPGLAAVGSRHRKKPARAPEPPPAPPTPAPAAATP